MRQLVILDRDGVINFDSIHYIKSPDEWIPIPGSCEAIARLNQAGFTIAIATNQSGIARGLYDTQILAAIHDKLIASVQKFKGDIDLIVYCPHHPDDNCDCRKPGTGLLQQIAKHYNLELSGIPFIGDSYRDIEAAKAIACRPILVKTGNGQMTIAQHPELINAIEIYEDLTAVTDVLIKHLP